MTEVIASLATLSPEDRAELLATELIGKWQELYGWGCIDLGAPGESTAKVLAAVLTDQIPNPADLKAARDLWIETLLPEARRIVGAG